MEDQVKALKPSIRRKVTRLRSRCHDAINSSSNEATLRALIEEVVSLSREIEIKDSDTGVLDECLESVDDLRSMLRREQTRVRQQNSDVTRQTSDHQTEVRLLTQQLQQQQLHQQQLDNMRERAHRAEVDAAIYRVQAESERDRRRDARHDLMLERAIGVHERREARSDANSNLLAILGGVVGYMAAGPIGALQGANLGRTLGAAATNLNPAEPARRGSTAQLVELDDNHQTINNDNNSITS